MPLTLIVEDGTGRPDANARASRAGVRAVLARVPFTEAWAACATEKQDQSIAEASAWLTRRTWCGIRTYERQALAFPRAHLVTPDGYAVASNLVPAWLIEAVARLAFWLSQQTATPFADSGVQPGTRLNLPGGLSFTVAGGVTMPPDVRALIAPYVTTSATVVRL